MPFKQTRQPRWNMLRIVLALTVGLLVLESGIHLSPSGHKAALLVIIIFAYGLIGWWIQANAQALEDQTADDCPRESWHSIRLQWNNGREDTSGRIDRLEDERSFDTLEA